jgi:hypothetical protein
LIANAPITPEVQGGYIDLADETQVNSLALAREKISKKISSLAETIETPEPQGGYIRLEDETSDDRFVKLRKKLLNKIKKIQASS